MDVDASAPGRQLAAWRAFLEAHAQLVDVLARELKDEQDLPLSWYDVLVHLSEAPDRSLRMQELAEAVLLSKSGLTRLVDRMQRAGLVERAACPSDRRGTFARLTDHGMQVLRDAAPTHVRGVEHHFASHLDDEEAALLERLMRRMIASEDGDTGPPGC